MGCAAILKTMHTLAGEDLNVDIVGACAAQEEVGVRGATVTAQVIKPDIAIVFEGCPADDTCVTQRSTVQLSSVDRCCVTLIPV